MERCNSCKGINTKKERRSKKAEERRKVKPLRLRQAKREGRRTRASSVDAVVESIRGWNSCIPRNCWVHAFRGAEETTLMKCRHLYCVGGWVNTLAVLPFFLCSLSCGRSAIATTALSHQLSQSSQALEPAGTLNSCCSHCDFLFDLFPLAASSLISNSQERQKAILNKTVSCFQVASRQHMLGSTATAKLSWA